MFGIGFTHYFINRIMAEFTDDDLMPFGKHKGEPIGEVSAEYLDWLHGQEWISKWPRILAYIEANRKLIDKELEENDE